MDHDLDVLTEDQLTEICADFDYLEDVCGEIPRNQSFQGLNSSDDQYNEAAQVPVVLSDIQNGELTSGSQNIATRPSSIHVGLQLATASVEVSNFLRSSQIFYEKTQRNHRLIVNSVEYLKIIKKRKTQHQCPYDIYAPDLYLENKSFFDIYPFNFSCYN